MESKRIEYIAVVSLLSAMALLMISSVAFETSTTDESAHLNYGIKILNLDSNRVIMADNTKMPFSVFNVILYKTAENILYSELPYLKISVQKQKHLCLSAGRLSTILFSLLLGFYVFRWSKELYGTTAAVFCLILYVFSPNIIAHSQLITTDLYASLMTTISTFYFWRFLKSGGRGQAVLSAFTLGLSQLAKYTCILLYPIFLIIVLVKYSNLIFRLIIEQDVRGLIRRFKVFLKYLLLFAAISILVINIGFLFNKPFVQLAKYEFKSDIFKSIQSIPILKNIPVPVPYPYLQGLDMLELHLTRIYADIYLLGKLRTIKGGGFKGYFFYAFLFKEPIAIQLFIFLSFVIFILNRKKQKFLENEIFFLLPAAFFTIYFNFFSKIQLGIRIILIIFPLLYIFCGNLFKYWEIWGIRLRSIFILSLAYLLVSVFSYFPHYLSYFNEIVWDRKKAYKLLADSNIDWGQDQWYINRHKERHPEIKINPRSPTEGRIVVSVNELVGRFDPEKYRWLRENFEPVDHIAYSYLVYEIRPEDLEKIGFEFEGNADIPR